MAMNRLTPAHHGAIPPPPGQLARYSSAPGSFLAALADSVTRDAADADPPPVSRFCYAEPSGLTSGESTCRTDGGGGRRRPLERACGYGGSGDFSMPPPSHQQQVVAPPRPAHVYHDGAQGKPPAVSPLFRQNTSPAGLLSHLMADQHGGFGR